ncbi:flagellar basal body P-ring formation chaperone FlgA [Aliikangiella coralliicola]|uniref:Flagellar basal body P-ring formation protein FlgA n=1 Tax=Aliikangiella coralliicola TaxID=2592383 RepID=A0A545U5Z1_9GAMM|nr:flagellar basal body P-ring formation chaperone FlgA [Aliikangiella coralliicola]TQV84876.1 flagellar basal body P-ring formation protein FlgA [Aliikangiella coralliicola]
MKLINDSDPEKLALTRQFTDNSMFFLMILLLIISLPLTAKNAENYQSLEEIRQAAKKFLEEKQPSADIASTEITVGHIDPRTRLQLCDNGLVAFLPSGSRLKGKTTVGVRCNGKQSWKLFLSAKIERYQHVWVTTRNLRPSDILTKSDLTRQRVLTTNMRKIPVEDIALIMNTSPKRSMRSGSVIFQDSVCMVCKGQKVSVSANSQFITINVDGMALNDAALGETAQVRNSKSKRIFGAIVTGKNQLSVNLAGTN